MIIQGRAAQITAMLAALSLLMPAAGGAVAMEKKVSRQEGEYRIYFEGREIGAEKYVLAASGGGITSSSTLDFRSPGAENQKITLETKLEADGQCVPRSYELKSEIDGQKGTIRGSFAPNQAIFEYSGGGVSRRNGLLVGKSYTILDSNIFHHFIFLARLYKYDGGSNRQAFDVVIPQEKDVGTLQISGLGKETIVVRGKRYGTTRLLVDSGSLQIQLWVDNDHIPRKIAVPDRGIEVLHVN
jgi:hypothetical protein